MACGNAYPTGAIQDMDELDLTTERAAILEQARVADASRIAAAIPAGNPGVCDECEEYRPRLVRGHCARCRDQLKLP